MAFGRIANRPFPLLRRSWQPDRRASLSKTTYRKEASRWRSVFFMLAVTALIAGCVARLVQLQLLEGQHYTQLAEQNRVRTIPMPAERGNILDRRGQLLATNHLARGVYLWSRQESPRQWKNTADRLSHILNIPASEILDRLQKVNYNSPLPIRLTQQIAPEAFVRLAEESALMPGVEVFAGSTRSYPYGSLAAHVLGYIGEATEADMKAHPDYPSGMIVGQMGIERLANATLKGKWGQRLVEVNANGQELRLLGTSPAQAGDDVRLTLDLAMQQAAERALNGRRGAVVALDTNTGAVLTLASAPTFDPGIFTRRVSQSEWNRLQQGDQPFLDRALKLTHRAARSKL